MKNYEYEIDDYLYGIVIRAIRNKKDLLKLLSHTIKYIIEQELTKEAGNSVALNGRKKLVVRINKMSRLFYCLEDKIISFHLPFMLSVSAKGDFAITYRGKMRIDSYLSSILIAVFDDEQLFDGSIVEIYEKIDNILHNNYEVENFDTDMFWELVTYLMIYEPGYIRFDDDPNPQRMDAVMHPRYHLDINYESTATYKIGLGERINIDTLIALLDITEKCMFIKDGVK